MGIAAPFLLFLGRTYIPRCLFADFREELASLGLARVVALSLRLSLGRSDLVSATLPILERGYDIALGATLDTFAAFTEGGEPRLLFGGLRDHPYLIRVRVILELHCLFLLFGNEGWCMASKVRFVASDLSRHAHRSLPDCDPDFSSQMSPSLLSPSRYARALISPGDLRATGMRVSFRPVYSDAALGPTSSNGEDEECSLFLTIL